jgi:hypothetical protein
METASSYETSVTIYGTAQLHDFENIFTEVETSNFTQYLYYKDTENREQ